MWYLRLIAQFQKASIQQELAYRANFFISILHSLLNLGTGVLGLVVVFGQVEVIQGWELPAALTLLGVYLTIGGLRNLFFGPSLDRLAGMDGEVWTGQFDFTLLRPVNVQFLASFRHWRLFALFDLLLALGTLGTGIAQLGHTLAWGEIAAFLVTLSASVCILYAILLAFSALVLFKPVFMYTWVFNSIFELARYPVDLYPGWLRLALTWIVPIGFMTTVPAQALTGELTPAFLVGSIAVAVVLFLAASFLFHRGLRHYSSASS
jgi:ABC-2 type transport system permease protein